MSWKVPLFKIYSDQDDIDVLTAVVKRGSHWAMGKEVAEFERALAQFVGTRYALAFNSGTSALHALLSAHGVEGGEVIVPSFTFISTANAVLLAGGKPVFAESEHDTFGLDDKDVRRKITTSTKAIIALHYGGFPSRDIVALRKTADEHRVPLIEDAAEALGAHIKGKKVGTFGDSAMFSFCQNKVITTGEGGALVTGSGEIYEKAKLTRSHGRVDLAEDYFSSAEDNDYILAGYGLRMPTMCAALGLSQLGKIDTLIELRRRHAHHLSMHLSKVEGVSVPKEINAHFQVYQMYTIKLPNEKVRDNLRLHLAQKGIMSKVYFSPVHLKTLYRNTCGYQTGDLPLTEAISKTVLSLPLYPCLGDEDLHFMVTAIEEFFKVSRGDRHEKAV